MPLDPKSNTPDGSGEVTHWRAHFPIDTVEDASRSRREFMGGLGIACGTMACGQVALNAVSPPNTAGSAAAPSNAEHGKYGDPLAKKFHEMSDGEAQLFHFPNHKTPCLFVKIDAKQYVAFAQKCTHLCCPVIPEVEKSEFHCPCHHGSFDLLTGEPKAGPPRSALPKVQVEIDSSGLIRPIGIG